MQLDGTKTKFIPISDNERQRRIANNLCLYCADPDHKRISCKLRIANEQKKILHNGNQQLSATNSLEFYPELGKVNTQLH